MKSLLIIAAFLIAGSQVSGRPEQAWQTYKSKHKKTYKSVSDETLRTTIWNKNFDKIKQHNLKAVRGQATYQLGTNEFTDMTENEKRLMLGAIPPMNQTGEELKVNLKATKIPKSISYVAESTCIPPIKHQEKCGSCWTFAAVVPLEYQRCKISKSKTPMPLSEQQLLSCSSKYGNNGCEGGWYTKAWEYLKKLKKYAGLHSAEDYPYKAKVDECKTDIKARSTRVVTWERIPKDEAIMAYIVATRGPISVAVFSNDNFLNYESGIFDDPSCPKTLANHAVVIVGYGSENGIDYWIVRNSWGANWGEGGYMRIRRGVNMCGIAKYAAIPTVVPT